MARKQAEQEPLLTAVARKLGQAAGTLANMLTADQAPRETNSQGNQDSADKGTGSPAQRNRTTKQSRSGAKKSSSKPKTGSSPGRRTAGAKRASLKRTKSTRQLSKGQVSKRKAGGKSSGRA